METDFDPARVLHYFFAGAMVCYGMIAPPEVHDLQPISSQYRAWEDVVTDSSVQYASESEWEIIQDFARLFIGGTIPLDEVGARIITEHLSELI